jgi:DNA-binding response OmpR family regulator
MVPEKTRPQKTVLVVEDEASIRVAVASYLRSSAFQILEAPAGLKLSPCSQPTIRCLLT